MNFLNGKKTLVGIILYTIGNLLMVAFPEGMEAGLTIRTLGEGMMGIGALHKINKKAGV